MIFSIIQSIDDHLFIGASGGSHIEIIIIPFIAGISTGDQWRCALSLFLQHSGCQMERTDLTVLLRTDGPENVIELHNRSGRVLTAVHKSSLKEIFNSFLCVVAFIVRQLFKLKNSVFL